MKIRLIEDLNVSENLLKEYKLKLEKLGHDFEYFLNNELDVKKQEELISDADVVMIGSQKLYTEAISKNPNLKYINVAFTGFDHVDINYCNKNNIKISNASGYSNTSVKEFVIAITLNIYRMICNGDKNTRNSKTLKEYYTGFELKGKTVGIIGTGQIGSEVAKLFAAFDCNIVAFSNTKKSELTDIGVEYISLDKLMSKSDIISIHLPLNKKTKGMISRDKLALMKKTAILINCARGPIVDTIALADALNNEKIAFAGIDVFDMEPPIPSEYPLLHSKNTLLQPHVAYYTEESMIKRAEIAFDNLFAYLDKNPKNIVN